MAGAEFAFEQILDDRGKHHILLRLRIELFFARREKYIHADGCELFAVIGKGTRIAVKVFVRPELQAVDEKAGAYCVAELARLGHQRKVAFVQVAHGRRKSDASAGSQSRTQFGDGGVDLHGLKRFQRRGRRET